MDLWPLINYMRGKKVKKVGMLPGGIYSPMLTSANWQSLASVQSSDNKSISHSL